MNIDDVHVRAVAGWDITVTAVGEGKEVISAVSVRINAFPEPKDNVEPAVKTWRKLYRQKGVYPGDNKLQVTVTDGAGKDTSYEDQWSA